MNYSKHYGIKLKSHPKLNGGAVKKQQLTNEEKQMKELERHKKKELMEENKKIRNTLKDLRERVTKKADELYCKDMEEARENKTVLPDKSNYKVSIEELAKLYEEAVPGEGEKYLEKVNLLRSPENVAKGKCAKESRQKIKEYLHENNVIGSKLKELMLKYTQLRKQYTNHKKNGVKVFTPEEVDEQMQRWAEAIVDGIVFEDPRGGKLLKNEDNPSPEEKEMEEKEMSAGVLEKGLRAVRLHTNPLMDDPIKGGNILDKYIAKAREEM